MAAPIISNHFSTKKFIFSNKVRWVFNDHLGKKLVSKNYISCQVLVAHTRNPSYLGGRDQEDCSLKPAQAKSSQYSISKKKKHHKKGLVEWLKV
jgi:hypothetical protein